jgi:ATP-dependent DNA helicase RecG
MGLLHGRMKSAEKDAIMKDFKDRKIDILVSTSVVEVGIDIPTATVMLIEGAERFGLAQLHQLRGRVGRGAAQSYCLLFSSENSHASMQRLQFFASHPKGIDIAQYDLEHRGPGTIYGTMQSGYLDLRYASLRDLPLITQVNKEVDSFYRSGSLPQFPNLQERLSEFEIELISKD